MVRASHFGATPEEWGWFDLILGLTEDLLPVVSNPHAEISPDSKMKDLGKTPSRYNQQGKVAGFAKWTEKLATGQEVERWSKGPDYGICLQTRHARALDIDVEDDARSRAILADWEAELGVKCPVRTRPNSGKRLALFVLEGELNKHRFKVEGGLVEILADKQQCVVAGTHTSGVRYEWPDGLPLRLPVVKLEDFERAVERIFKKYGTEALVVAKRREGAGDGELADDDVARHLEANWPTFGSQGGKLFVTCPWKLGHSMDSGETEAAWMLAGTGGYARGHFECLHASCQGRTDQEFLQAVAYEPTTIDAFQDVPVEPARDNLSTMYTALAHQAGVVAPASATKLKGAAHPVGLAALPLPGFERSGQGKVLATIGNAVTFVSEPEACGVRLRFDTFRGELVIASADSEDWRPFEDADAVDLRMLFAKLPSNAEAMGKELMRDAITKVARDNRFDTAIEWLENIVPAWDGVPRIERFYPDYFKTEDTPYTRAVGLYVWTAHAGRVLSPGCQADMATILTGSQGLLKSSGIMAMSPSEEFYGKIDLELKDADLSRQLRGMLVGELDELKGLAGRQGDSIRAWMTKRFEKWTPKYQEYGTTFPRRMIIHGTSNPEEVLADETGERRWLPMKVLGMVDVARIEADRLQLWAEGRERWKAEGILWQEAERLARGEHHKFKATDPWEGPVERWLDTADTNGLTPRDLGVRGEDVLVFALGIEASKVQRRDEQRLGSVLRALGMERVLRRVDGKPTRVWVDASQDLA